jgi:hypothetical protein
MPAIIMNRNAPLGIMVRDHQRVGLDLAWPLTAGESGVRRLG